MSAGKEFQTDGAATEKARRRRRASSVRVRGTASSGASDERRVRIGMYVGLYQVTEIRRSGCGPHLVGQQSHFVGDPLSHRKPVK